LSVEEFKTTSKIPVVVVLDNIRSLNNIGSVFRTSDAFLIEKIYLCGITAKPPHKDIHKTALGATDSVQWEYAASTLEVIEDLKKKSYCCVSIEQAEHASMLDSYSIENQPYALVFGNEVMGVDQEVVSACDQVIEIPQSGTKHSLNISVSAGLVLWEFYKHFKS
jgi:tRNA G18 (ribose-2'-O)-methylase SpoU